jgi:hypothetical protein
LNRAGSEELPAEPEDGMRPGKEKKLATFEQIDAARKANLHGAEAPLRKMGSIKNEALHRRLCARERDVCLAILGWETEDRSSWRTMYAATTGELRQWAHEKLVGGPEEPSRPWRGAVGEVR